MKHKRKVFIDFEYLNRGSEHPVNLVSVGMVDDQGNELYGINVDAPLSALWQNRWTRENLWPTLPLEPVNQGAIAILDWDATHPDIAHVRKLENLREDVLQFLIAEGEPEIWGWCSGFDYVLLSQLWGTFDDRPPLMPMFIHDLEQLAVNELEPDAWNHIQRQCATEATEGASEARHNALVDAREIRRLHAGVMEFRERGGCPYDCSACHAHCEEEELRCGAGCTVSGGPDGNH